jgi:folate-binding protein YgfZ
MSAPSFQHLSGRAALRIAGPDARTFLQGMISNDIGQVSPSRVMWAAFLTPQGKYLHDFFVCEHGGGLLLEGEAARLPDLKRRLSIFRLRSQVTIEELGTAFGVWGMTGQGAAAAAGLSTGDAGTASELGGGVVFVDPRLAAAGLRALLPAETGAATLLARGFVAADGASHEARRIRLGLPDGSRDMLIEKSLLLEGGFDELRGIDWEKGCYLGQELTARTRWRGLVKRRLLPVQVDGPVPVPGTPIELDGREIGEVRSGTDGWAMAMLRLDALAAIRAAGGVSVGSARLMPQPPAWAVLPAEALETDAR